MSGSIICDDCGEVMLRKSYGRHRRRRHPELFPPPPQLCRGVSVVDAAAPPATSVFGGSSLQASLSAPTSPVWSTAMLVAVPASAPAATAPETTPHVESRPGIVTSSSLRASSAMNQLVEAAHSLLMQLDLNSVDELSDHVQRNFASVPEHELFPLVVGAIAGAQLAAAHHFVVERGRASYASKMVHKAIKSGSNLAMWNMGLGRLEASSSETSSVPVSSLPPAPPSQASPTHAASHQPRIQYERGSGMLLGAEHDARSVVYASVTTPSAPVVEPYVPAHISTAPVPPVMYRPTPSTQLVPATEGPHVSAVMSTTSTDMTRTLRSPAGYPDPSKLCLPVSFSRAVEALDSDILEAATREAGIRPPSERPASVVIPDVVVDSELSDIEPTVTTTSNTLPTAPSVAVTATPVCRPAPASAASSSAASMADTGHPRRSMHEPRDSRRRPADSRLDSPSPRRHSPPRRRPGGRFTRPPPSGRYSPPVDLRLSQSEYRDFKRFQQRRRRE